MKKPEQNKEIMMKSAQSYLQGLADDMNKKAVSFGRSLVIYITEDLKICPDINLERRYKEFKEAEELFTKEYERLSKEAEELICNE